jgi:hypothetical protein
LISGVTAAEVRRAPMVAGSTFPSPRWFGVDSVQDPMVFGPETDIECPGPRIGDLMAR